MFSIFTDTSANLPTPFVKQHNVQVVPFTYLLDGKECACLDTETFDGPSYYARIKHTADVRTSQVPPQRYIDAFTPALAEGNDILFVGMSSGISGSFSAAVIASKQLRREYPERKICLVDTLAASLGEGLFVIDAIGLRDAGLTADVAAAALLQSRQCVYQAVVLDDLKYLHKTGRVSGKAAIIGSVLNIKPILKGDPTGKLVVCDKVRGKKSGLRHLAKKYAELSENAEDQVVGIAYTDCPQDAAYLAELIQQEKPPRMILNVCYEPVTGSHVGPGTVALFYKGADNVRTK